MKQWNESLHVVSERVLEESPAKHVADIIERKRGQARASEIKRGDRVDFAWVPLVSNGKTKGTLSWNVNSGSERRTAMQYLS